MWTRIAAAIVLVLGLFVLAPLFFGTAEAQGQSAQGWTPSQEEPFLQDEPFLQEESTLVEAAALPFPDVPDYAAMLRATDQCLSGLPEEELLVREITLLREHPHLGAGAGPHAHRALPGSA